MRSANWVVAKKTQRAHLLIPTHSDLYETICFQHFSESEIVPYQPEIHDHAVTWCSTCIDREDEVAA